MVKCKDCLHHKVCRTWFILVGYSEKKADEISKIESKSTFCQNFKDKATPVRHGKWISNKAKEPTKLFSCSECEGLIQLGHYAYKCYYDYFPTCGAKMDGGEEDA